MRYFDPFTAKIESTDLSEGQRRVLTEMSEDDDKVNAVVDQLFENFK